MCAWSRASRRRRVKRLQVAQSARGWAPCSSNYVPADIEAEVAGHLVEQRHDGWRQRIGWCYLGYGVELAVPCGGQAS